MTRWQRPILCWLLLVMSLSANYADATGKPKHKPPTQAQQQTVLVEQHDNSLVGALIGAGITYWLIHRHKKRRAPRTIGVPPVAHTPPNDCDARVERVQQACIAK